MKKLNFITLIFAGLLVIVSFSPAAAQQEELPNDDAPKNFNSPRRPNLLAELDLSPEQIKQIRRLNAEKRPLIREAQQRVRDANRRLDQAIYADDADETEIQSRLKDVQTAQAEVARIRSSTEYAVRKVLTPEQLVRFREVRQKFMERLKNSSVVRKNPSLNAPNRRLVNRQRRMRAND